MGKTKNAKSLTHEEIWDDSALVRSWDEAVEEYRLYHSIHAKGQNVEDVLREAEEAELAGEDEAAEEREVQMVEDDASETEMNDASAYPDEAAAQAVPQLDSQSAQHTAAHEPAPGTTSGSFPPASVTMPHPALSQVQDEGLKNLMMAWYYAGYYTGLYEGQQQANQSKSS